MDEKQLKEINVLIEKLFAVRDSSKNQPENKELKRQYKKMQEECAEKLYFLVEMRTKRYKKFANYDDLCQDGRLALFMAIATYNPVKGDFIWWANKYIKTKISREANKHSTIKIPLKKASLEQPFKVSTIPIMIDTAPTAFERLSQIQSDASVNSAINKLPTKQQTIIKLHFDLNSEASSSIGKICDILDISRMNCIKLLNDAKINLKNELTKIKYAEE